MVHSKMDLRQKTNLKNIEIKPSVDISAMNHEP